MSVSDTAAFEWVEATYRAPYISPSLLPFNGSAPLSPPGAEIVALFDQSRAVVVSFALPSLWPNDHPELALSNQTRAQIAWNEHGLHILYRLSGQFRPPVSSACGTDKLALLNDSRVEVFVFPMGASDQYYGYEVNREGRALDFKAKFVKQFDYQWTGHARGSCSDSDGCGSGCLFRLSVPWTDFDFLPSSCTVATLPALTAGARVGLYRGDAVDAAGRDHHWTSWIDPKQSDVNFHTPRTFAQLVLMSESL